MPRLPSRWYVLYVKARHEKFVNEWLTNSGYKTFLPLVKTLKEWSDRKKYVHEPLFSNYMFIRVTERQIAPVKDVPGVIKFVEFRKELATIPQKQIDNIKKILSGRFPVEVDNLEELEPGVPVKVLYGPMQGLEGELIERRGKKRMAVSVNNINKSILVEIPPEHLKVIKQNENEGSPEK